MFLYRDTTADHLEKDAGGATGHPSPSTMQWQQFQTVTLGYTSPLPSFFGPSSGDLAFSSSPLLAAMGGGDDSTMHTRQHKHLEVGKKVPRILFEHEQFWGFLCKKLSPSLGYPHMCGEFIAAGSWVISVTWPSNFTCTCGGHGKISLPSPNIHREKSNQMFFSFMCAYMWRGEKWRNPVLFRKVRREKNSIHQTFQLSLSVPQTQQQKSTRKLAETER